MRDGLAPNETEKAPYYRNKASPRTSRTAAEGRPDGDFVSRVVLPRRRSEGRRLRRRNTGYLTRCFHRCGLVGFGSAAHHTANFAGLEPLGNFWSSRNEIAALLFRWDGLHSSDVAFKRIKHRKVETGRSTGWLKESARPRVCVSPKFVRVEKMRVSSCVGLKESLDSGHVALRSAKVLLGLGTSGIILRMDKKLRLDQEPET